MANDKERTYTEQEAFALARYMFLLGREHGQEDRTLELDLVDGYIAGELAAIRGGRPRTRASGREGGGANDDT